MANQFSLKNLTECLKKDTYYRLDYVTGLDLAGNYQADKKFTTMLVNFCEYSPEYQDINRIKSLSNKDRFKNLINREKIIVTTVVVPEDITNCFFLKPGSVWRNGALVWEPSDSLNIEINQVHKIETNFKNEFNESERKKHPFLRDKAYSNLIKFPNSIVNSSVVTVLMPAMEVIRYYYSGSRYFTTQLFNGGMEDDDQFQSAFVYKHRFNQDNKSIYIWLRRKCYDSDAVLLARAIADTDARNAMRLIYSSLIRVVAKYERETWDPLKKCCPKTHLPFGDTTEMEVQGQWLWPNENGEFTTYLVRAIDRCNHSFPFESIEIESVDSSASSGKKSSALKPQMRNIIDRGDEDRHHLTLTQGQEPNESFKAQELEFYIERFSPLSEIEIFKVKRTSEKDMETYQKNEAADSLSDEGSTQTGNYQENNNLEPWEIMARDAESIPISERLNLTAETVKSISRSSGFSVIPLPADTLDSSQPYGFYEFKKPYGKPANYKWSYIGNRSRKALFLEVGSHQNTIYLLEIEGNHKSGYSLYLLSQLKVADIKCIAESFLQSIADKSGNGIIAGVFSKYFTIVTSLKHITNSDDSFSDRLLRTLNDALGHDEYEY